MSDAVMNPAEIAREAFKRLATRRIAPTPDNYRDLYNEVAGVTTVTPNTEIVTVGSDDTAIEKMLDAFSRSVAGSSSDLSELGNRLTRALKAREWDTYGKALAQIVERYVKKPSLSETLLPIDGQQTKVMREMLARTLSFAVASLSEGKPTLVAEAEALGAAVKLANTERELNDVQARLKQLCYQIEISSGDHAEQQELLMRLFRLLLENITELLDDDSWLRGQIDVVQSLIAGPIDNRKLEDATRSLKEVIYKQGKLKHSITDARTTIKNMMMTFIDRLGTIATSTGDFHEKIGGYSEKISHASDITELNAVLDEVLRETKLVQAEALNSRDKMIAARQEAEEAEARIHTLEAKLKHMSEMVREDQLTGSLNRRGLDDVYERETARAARRGTPLCIAMLDLDDFKRLNDTHGHLAGDGALKHLVKIVKDTLRSIDVIARYGGEEFLILMPETSLDEAVQTMTRVQRELTKHFFMHENEKLLITFSCGVALREPDEDQVSLVKRADMAMYKAKKTGKNRVVAAE
ncbi:MAG TPA: GGDEF domain-containing protein [Burkholderiaceae bacterium]